MDLRKKLRIDPEQPLWVINGPDEVLHYFDGLTVRRQLRGKTPVAQLMLFAADSIELAKWIPILAPYIAHETLFWIAYPKKTGVISSDLVQMKAWDIVFQSGYRGQTSVSIDDDWTGLRVTNAPKKVPTICDLPMEERKVEGIDFVHRTVQLPADAQSAVNAHEGLSDFFYHMPFTHKKEYVLSIVEAKKEDTRLRRIEKMVEMLAKQKTKAAKK